MKLIPISEHPDSAKILYDLLAEREPSASISHKKMPTWEEHLVHVGWMAPPSSRQAHSDVGDVGARLGEPRYQGWFLIQVDDLAEPEGAIYLTRRNEIGVAIFRKWRGYGYGPRAVRLLIEKYGPAHYLANVAPANEASRKMFEKLGFRTIQHTLALDAD